MNTLMLFLGVILMAAVMLFAVVSGGMQNRGGQRRRGGTARGGSSFTPRTMGKPLDRQQTAARWLTIQTMASSGGGNGLRTAVLEADKLLDHALRSYGAAGDTMGERLKSFRGRFTNNNGVWRAHKLRNTMAHEVGFDLVPSQAKEALADFERALKDLGSL